MVSTQLIYEDYRGSCVPMSSFLCLAFLFNLIFCDEKAKLGIKTIHCPS